MNRGRYLAALAVLVAAFSVTTTAAARPPEATPATTLIGPIPNTTTSHAFNTSTVDLASHGYLEEEYFLRGTANVYDCDPPATS
jgi:hypothetical protein